MPYGGIGTNVDACVGAASGAAVSGGSGDSTGFFPHALSAVRLARTSAARDTRNGRAAASCGETSKGVAAAPQNGHACSLLRM